MRSFLIGMAFAVIALAFAACSSAGDWDRLNACHARGIPTETCPRPR